MRDIQEAFNKIQENKKEAKEIRKEYRDILSQDKDYQEICDKIKDLQEIKKQHELSAENDMGTRWERLEELKFEMKKLKEMQDDIGISTLMNGETVEVRNEHDELYEPKFGVDFKKVN